MLICVLHEKTMSCGIGICLLWLDL